MRRGFYTGLAAALLFFSLSVLWLLSASQSYRDASGLSGFEALKVAERAQDALPFFSSSIVDAEGDAAFAVHGCVPAGDFCTAAFSRVVNYSNASATRLSARDLRVVATLYEWSCLPAVAGPGFTHAYELNVSFNVTFRGGPVRALRWVNQSDSVQVNATSAFASRVASSGPAGVWSVGVTC
ncbi:hypothetical protein HYV43_07290 [Candidatus Micrarchaeota archaeon]|nr:hypothetical protein [Candidatus Micrarchaeota archaeon]